MDFKAPWARVVKLLTVMTCGILLLVVYDVGRRFPYQTSPVWLWFLTSVLPLLLLAGGLLCTVRGYRLEAGSLEVKRLLWSTRIDLSGLRAAWHDPEAMCRSLRLFGNGGMFVIAGLFTSKKLGRYRAFATDPSRSVVLDFGDRKILVTPDPPEEFVSRLGVPGPDTAFDLGRSQGTDIAGDKDALLGDAAGAARDRGDSS